MYSSCYITSYDGCYTINSTHTLTEGVLLYGSVLTLYLVPLRDQGVEYEDINSRVRRKDYSCGVV